MFGVGGAAVGLLAIQSLMEEALTKAVDKKLAEEAHSTIGMKYFTYKHCTTSYQDEETGLTNIGCQLCDQKYSSTEIREGHPNNVEVTLIQNCKKGCSYHGGEK